MECKKCGTPAIAGASFCANCGARVDGKKACEACGQFNDENNVYCVYCGTRMDSKTACETCGTVYEGNFCPACGHAKAETRKPAKKTGESKGLFKKICDIVSGGSMIFGVLCSFIFVFFIGLILRGNFDGDMSESDNIFYFFGDFYKDLKDLDGSGGEMTPWFENLIKGQAISYGVIGTVISALTILCVVGFGTVAVVKYILGWVNKKESKIDGWAIACGLSFLVGAALFYAHIHLAMKVELYDEEMFGVTKFTGATVAGIVLVVVALGIGVVARMLTKGKELWKNGGIIKTTLAIVGVVLAGVLLALAQNSAFAIGMEIEEVEMELKATFMVANLAGDILGAMSLTPEMANYYDITETLNTVNVYNTISQLLTVALAVFAALAIAGHLRGAMGKKNFGLVWSICSAAVSVALLIFSILAFSGMESIIDLLLEETGGKMPNDALEGEFGVAICGVVFSMVLTAVSVVRGVFVKKTAVEE